MKLLSSVMILASIFSFVGCGGNSGAPRLRGTACTQKYDPIPVEMNEKVGTKISSKVSERFSKLPAGEYAYEGADYIYKRLTDLPYEDLPKYTTVHLKDTLHGDEGYKLLNTCVSNVDKNTVITLKQSDVVGISKLTVAKDKTISYSTKAYRFSLVNGQIAREGDAPIQQKGAPADFFKGVESQYDIYQYIADTELYEIRFRDDIDKNTSIYLAVRFRRTDIKK